MSDTALARSAKDSAMLAEFSWGATPQVRRYTDYTAPLNLFGQRFEPTPEMQVDLPAVTGALKESPIGITLPLDDFTDPLSIAEPHARVLVVVREYIFADLDSWVETHFQGYVDRAIRNYQGKPRSVRLEAVNLKQLLDVPLGLQANVECNWTFGGVGCGHDVETIAENHAIIQLVGSSITVSGMDENKQWVRGFVQLDGLRIGIRTRVGQTLGLRRSPPRRWAGQTVRCYPGCRKTITDCRFYLRETQFGGFGFAIPAHHPIIETP